MADAAEIEPRHFARRPGRAGVDEARLEVFLGVLRQVDQPKDDLAFTLGEVVFRHAT